MLLLCALLVAPPADDARLLTGLVASAAAEDARADVLTAADLKSALEVESQKQLLSCDASQSCLAEIAAALDAAVVISGSLGQLDDERLLQLSAFDAKKASSAGRQTARAATTKDLAAQAETAARKLVAQALSSTPAGTRLRILVLDIEAVGGVVDPEPAAPSPFGVLSVVGVGAGVVGAVGLVVGVVADQSASGLQKTASDPDSNVVDARAAGDAIGGSVGVALVGYGAAVVGLGLGAALVIVDVVGGAE